MVTANVIERVLHVKTPAGSTGTAFVVEHDGKSYIVTAAHVVTEGRVSDHLLLRSHEEWFRQPIRVLGIDEGADVAVLVRRGGRPHKAFSPVGLGVDGLTYGQRVFFLGYPYGQEGGTRALEGRPLPFVKAGIVSMFADEAGGDIWVDAHGNEGFSGGPMAFKVEGRPGRPDWSIGGVVSRGPFDPTAPEQKRTAGFVVIGSMDRVIRLIEAEPAGVPVLDQSCRP